MTRDNGLLMNILNSNELQVLFQNRLAGLEQKQLLPEQINSCVSKLAQRQGINSKIIGFSFAEQAINCVSLGSGPTKILMWTQMHGDESTATSAVLDIIHLLSCDESQSILANHLPSNWASLITLFVVPMLNPDGALANTRENAQGIDINRDALALQSPEGRILNDLVQELQADFAFNLHDQHDYYRCGDKGKSSTLAFLAPAFDPQKSIDTNRRQAMALIALMYKQSNVLLPDGIARYDDEFSARSFGDQIAKSGISTILIESGHYPNDELRQVARTMNVFTLLSALKAICEPNYWCSEEGSTELEALYWQIPENREYKLCDLLIKQVSFADGSYTADIAIRKNSRFEKHYMVADLGDLHEQYGLSSFDAAGYDYDPGRPYLLKEHLCLTNESYAELLNQGFSHFVGDANLLENRSDYYAFENPKFWHDRKKMTKGIISAGFLCKGGQRAFAIIMADLIEL